MLFTLRFSVNSELQLLAYNTLMIILELIQGGCILIFTVPICLDLSC